MSTKSRGRWGTTAKLRLSTDENFRQTRRFTGQAISRAAFEAIRAFTAHCYLTRQPLFEQRVADGWIRDCHGDLHLDHIHITGDKLHIYDCIEFNDRLRHLDIASDAAFLAMDLDHHGRPDLAGFFIHKLAALLDDPRMSDLMDFYKCYRAYVRGKVESLRGVAEIASDAGRATAAAAAKRYFQLALQYAVAGSAPKAFVVMGRVASGKSTLATALARELGWPVVSSDVLRLCERCRNVVSDARPADLAMLDAAFEPPDELPPDALLRISTAAPPARSLRKLLTALATHRDSAIAGASA